MTDSLSPLIIRFTKTWFENKAPLTLIFGGDVEPPIPVDNTIGIECGFRWVKPVEVENRLVLVESARQITIELNSPWTAQSGTAQLLTFPWSSIASQGIEYTAPWQLYDETRSDWSIRWTLPKIHQTNVDIIWQPSKAHGISDVLRWLNIAAEEIHTVTDWQDGANQQINQVLRYHGSVCDDEQSIKWGPHAPRWVCSTRYLPPVGKVTMRFGEPWASAVSPLQLRFTPSAKVCYFDDGGGLIDAHPTLPSFDFKIPIEPQIRRYYLMQPTITCVRVSDNLPIVITSCSISQSRGQWAKSVSMEFSSRIDAQRAHNELLLITINGYEFYAIAEQPSSSKVFGSETHSSTGRSRAAELASPYLLPISYTNTVARSFGGIISDILQQGAPTAGWTVELNGIADFTVPAGAFSVGNKSPIDAINEAATQLGCMILADDATRKLTIIPRWPTAPWLMATAVPDLTLHDAVITNYSESVERNPLCDVVWLRGEQQGISAKVKRTGSAGNIPAPDINAQLIVDNQAARIAGTNALADTGDKLNINLTLPVMADLPPAVPGMLIGIREGAEVFKGTCDSWSIRASVTDRGDIDIEQTITVIRSIA
jgi:hypothetical protein